MHEVSPSSSSPPYSSQFAIICSSEHAFAVVTKFGVLIIMKSPLLGVAVFLALGVVLVSIHGCGSNGQEDDPDAGDDPDGDCQDHNVIECDSNGTKQFPSMRWALSGYNVFKGNPFGGPAVMDPGFQKLPLFKSDYSKCQDANRYSYMQPKGFTITKMESCAFDGYSHVYNTATSMKQDMSNSIKIGADVQIPGAAVGAAGVKSFGGGFGYSSSLATHFTENTQTHMKTVRNTIECVQYSVKIDHLGSPPETSSCFERLFSGLSSKGDYYDMFDSWGTHFVEEVCMGSRFSRIRSFTSAGSRSISGFLKSNGLSIDAAAQIQAGVQIGGSVESKKDKSQEIADEMFSMQYEEEVLAIGLSVTNMDQNAWEEASFGHAMPIKYSTRYICDHPIFKTDSTKEALCFKHIETFCEDRYGDEINCGPPGDEDECQWDYPDCGKEIPSTDPSITGNTHKVCKQLNGSHVQKCVDEPECKLTLYRDKDYGGERLHLTAVRSMDPANTGVRKELPSNFRGSDQGNGVGSYKFSAGCADVVFIDDDGPPHTRLCQWEDKKQWNEKGEGPRGESSMGYDLNDDVCGVILFTKTISDGDQPPEVTADDAPVLI
jgi:hypothetical protein